MKSARRKLEAAADPLRLLCFGDSARAFAMTKYIVVSGGVVSGIGKGVIGALAAFPLRTPSAMFKPAP